MKKMYASVSILLLMTMCLSGCQMVGSKSSSLTIVYGAAAILSLLLLIAYGYFIRNKNRWFLLMFSSVLVVNIGYFCLAISSSLSEALLANRISYLGSVLLPMAMLMIILNVTNTKHPAWLKWCLFGLSAVIFFIAASPGYLDIYYKEVSFEIVNGTATLVKVYGPLHPLYLFYLLGYFGSMIMVIIHAQAKKTIDSASHAVIIAIAVFVNIGVWFIEQLVHIEFEILSISYIISELFLLGAHLLMNENQQLKELVSKSDVTASDALSETPPEAPESTNPELPVQDPSADLWKQFTEGFQTLTPRELDVFHGYVAGKSTKDIMAELDIKENTLKYHSRNLYGKLGVSSRKELVAIYKQALAAGILIQC